MFKKDRHIHADEVFLISELENCNKCLTGKLKNPASYLCKTCLKLYCVDCVRRHIIIKPCGNSHVENIRNHNHIYSVRDLDKDSVKFDLLIKHLNPRKKNARVMDFDFVKDENHFSTKKQDTAFRSDLLLKVTPMTTPRSLMVDKNTPRPDLVLGQTSQVNVNCGINEFMKCFPKDKATQREPNDPKDPGIHLKYETRFSAVVERHERIGAVGSLAISERNCLILFDRPNNKIKLFDQDFNCQVAMSTPYGCWGMTIANECVIALTCKNKVCFFSVVRRETKWYEKPRKPYIERIDLDFTLRGTCYGIAYCKSLNVWFVTCDIYFSDPSMHILESNGSTRKLLRWTKHLQGGNPFTEFFCLDEERACIYLSDYRDKNVVCMSFDGSFVWVVPMNGDPRAIVLCGDFIFVTQNNNCLCMLHRDGTYIKSIMDFDYVAGSICYNDETKTLFISGTYWGISHHVNLYKIMS